MDIKHLFDPSKDIYWTIEKVITYGADQKHRLKAEISEYVVTESIEDQLERLLSSMQAAMEPRRGERSRGLGVRLLRFWQEFVHEISGLALIPTCRSMGLFAASARSPAEAPTRAPLHGRAALPRRSPAPRFGQ